MALGIATKSSSKRYAVLRSLFRKTLFYTEKEQRFIPPNILYNIYIYRIHHLTFLPNTQFMKKTLLSVLLCLMAIGTQATTVTYTVDNNTIFPNPERGFYLHTEKHLSESDTCCLYKHSTALNNMDTHRSADNGSLVLIVYYLDNYRTTEKLPSKIFEGFKKDMATLREKGMKCILRFAYTQTTYKYKEGDKTIESAEDATLNIALSHLSQYKEYLQKNADVIYVVQAGFVGAWGEWYYTDNFGNKGSEINSKRKTLVDSLLSIVPSDRYVQLRTPLFKTSYLEYKNLNSSALTKEEAYKNTPKARLGHHNDAFLYGPKNMGTYNDTATQKPYLAKETLYVPMGGECDVDSVELAQIYCTREKTIADMSRLHWTYINKGYATKTTNMWRKNGTFDELNLKMGYRYQLIDGYYSTSVAQGAQMTIQMNIKNVGFAPLYNFRKARIVLKNGSYTKSIALKSDPRTWKPNGVITNIDEKIDIPADMPTGTYQLYLHLPDTGKQLKNKPAYAIRFANKNMWDEATGMNNLNAQVTVTASGNTGNYVSISGTLNKSNVASVSNDMTYYNTDYFDFGPTDAQNTGRWAEWNINVSKSGEYTITTTGSYTNGHQWNLILDGDEDHPYSMPSSHKKGEVVTETGTTTWYLSKGTHTICVRNVKPWGQPKLLSVNLTKAASPAIVLPATLNMANVSEVSDNMAYYESDYFDFGPVGVKEQTSYAKWDIQIPSAGNYSVTIEGYYPNGHRWEMELEKTEIAYTLPATWDKGIETVTWNLPAGTYTLVIHNIMEWGRPKLKSITLTGAANHKPQAIDEVQDTLDQNAPMYDIMGRRVDASYKGIVIQNNKKYLLW